MKIKLRTSSSIVNFRDKAEKALGLERYDHKTDGYNVPVVFLGLYHKNDYDSFRRPRIKRYVLWSGGDIENFKRGYLYGDGEGLEKSKKWKWLPWKWFIKRVKVEHFCENTTQQKDLAKEGIKAKVVPAFWGNIDEFPISYKESDTGQFQVYICGHPDREEEYGIMHVKDKLSKALPDVRFHIYGVEGENHKNITYHGIVSEEQFNKEIKNYHCLLRLNDHDGFSDVLAKAILMGQYPISKIVYDLVLTYSDEHWLIRMIQWAREQKRPYLEARQYYLERFNKYSFIKK